MKKRFVTAGSAVLLGAFLMSSDSPSGDFAVWRPLNGTWYLLLSSSNYSYAASRAHQWGLPGDIPLGKW